MINNTKVYIQADRQLNGDYVPTEVSSSLNRLAENFEYYDVVEGEYQIWEYPSGKIYAVKPSAKVTEDHLWSLASPDTWLPRLALVGVNKEAVEEAYKRLSTL